MKHIKLFEEYINEGSVKTFEMGMKALTKMIKKGMGWIDPSYLEETYAGLQKEDGEFFGMAYADVREEIFQRLIDDRLLYFEANNNPGGRGPIIRDLAEIPAHLNEAEDGEDKASTDQGPLDNEAVETGLANKKKETGAPIGILRAVFRRGMAAWKSGHRPGAGQEQWAYARVNSFLTGGEGTWGKADEDLAKEARAAGFDAKKK